MKLVLILLITFTSIFMFSATPALADLSGCDPAGPEWLDGIGVKCGNLIATGCIDSHPSGASDPIDTPCGLTEAFQTIINFTQILLALTGSVVILMFVYGGTMMIVGGAGSGDSITKGKEAIKAAVIGLVIILTAWLIINFTILALTEGEVGGTAQLFGRGFSETPSGAVE